MCSLLTFQNSSKATLTQENKRNQCVFDKRFRTQAKLPLGKHGLYYDLFLNERVTIQQPARFLFNNISLF